MKKLIFPACLILMAALAGCKKFLDAKPDQKLEIPVSLTDFQALLDRYPVMNTRDPSAGEASCDDYYLLTADYLALTSNTYQNIYTWQKDNLFIPGTVNDWYACYVPVFTANTVIQGLTGIITNAGNIADYNNVKGQAYFIRGKFFFCAVSLWAKAYNPQTAVSDLGIPIRLTTDFNDKSVRSTNLESYNQLISDMKTAIAYLPVKATSPERPSKPAAYGILARIYLSMSDYSNAGLYADSCLQLYNTLINYNSLGNTASYPFAKFNAEVLYDAQMTTLANINNVRSRIDTNLYRSYEANDLRKTLYYKAGSSNTKVFRGSYEGAITLFDGIATDEIYLIRAECYARAGRVQLAEADLNTLLSNRYQTGSYVPVTTTDPLTVLDRILTERRKELVMRGVRWQDLKRLNKAGAAITLYRNVNNMQYILPPNDDRYVLPIPDDIIQLTGMQQNPR